MKNNHLAKKLFLFLILCVFSLSTFPCFAEESTTPEPYTSEEFPEWAKDLRRTEIISFGSLPFVTLGVSIGYGGYLYATGVLDSFPNPLNKSENSFDTDQQVTVLEMSLAISFGLGLTDYIINLIQRSSKNKRLKKIQESKEKISVTPLTPEEAAELLRKNSSENETNETDVNEISEGQQEIVNDDSSSEVNSTTQADTSVKSESTKE